MNNRLYVGNLSYEASTDALRDCFAEYGEVSETHIVMDRESGRARGFAFVTMKTEADASNAVAKLNGAMFDGRPLRVNVAEERGARAGGGGGGGGGGNRNARGGHRGW
jgi:cold-inducible RNA-binding protein